MTSDGTTTRRGRRALTVGGILAALLIAAVVWFLADGAPAAVDIDTAAGDLTTTTTDAGGTAGSVTGTWNVDTSVGEFSVTDTTGTFVGFRIQEELANVGATEAVGRTPQVSGSVTVEGTTLTAAEFTADMTAIVSDEARRDDRIQSALETGTHPTATFVLTEPVELGEVDEGEVIEVDATGTMTIHGVSRAVTAPLEAVWEGDVVVVTGSFDVTFADYEVAVPTAPVVLSVEDHGDVELQLYVVQG